MFLTKLKLAAAGGVLILAAWFAVWPLVPTLGGQDARVQPPAQAAKGELPPAPRQKRVAGAGTLLLARKGSLVALTPDGKEGEALAGPDGTHTNFDGRLSPDGALVAYTVTADEGPRPPQRVGEEPQPWPFKIVVRKLGAAEPSAVIDMPAQELRLIWSADGKRLILSKLTGAPPNHAIEVVTLDPATRKSQVLDLPPGVQVLDGARDGKTFLVVRRRDKEYELCLAAIGDKDVRVLTTLHDRMGEHAGRFAPDGTRILYTDADPAEKDAHKWGMSRRPYVFDLTTKKRTAVADFPLNGCVEGIAWSPDGKRIAYTWRQVHAELLKKDTLSINDVRTPTEAFLIIADVDGRNPRTVSSARGEYAINMILGAVDWR